MLFHRHALKALILATALFSSISPLASAQSQLNIQANEPNFTQQRLMFKKAEKLVWNPSNTHYKNLYQQLYFYPLQPYLDQQELLHSLTLKNTKKIDVFLTKHEGTPLDFPLRKKWLNYLAKKDQKSLFVHFFKYKQSAKLTCLYHQYQVDQGKSIEALGSEIDALWLKGKSQPKQCDGLFKRWKKAGYLTEEKIWKRISLAADGGDHTLIPYLTKLLPKKDRYISMLWHRVRRDPSRINALSAFKKQTEKEAQVLAYGVKRLIWRKPEQAITLFNKTKSTYPYTQDQLNEITVKFALALASKNHEKAQHWLHKVEGDALNNLVAQWRLAEVLRHENWEDIKNELLSFPESKQDSNQWKYWYGRSLLATDNLELGEEVLNNLSEQRHYYGFLAASHMKKDINLQDNPIEITEIERNSFLKNETSKRAFELFHLGRYRDARREWNHLIKHLDTRGRLVASKIAHEKNWFDRAIFTLSKEGYLNDVSLRFPRAFNYEINKYAKAQKLDPAWAFAIARRESSFMTDASSPVGAKGLMQLMPKTAKRMANKRVSTKYLQVAKNNIKLGTKYLRLLLDKHKGNQVLATAAYNAGPYRVKTWLKDADILPVDIWIETIPYTETRNYVKSVMAYQQIYSHKAGESTVLFDNLLAMQIPENE